ncbi:MAG TPA: HAD family hydrolase [Methylomusa anaerophila]|uniref:Haloacid dehalogenase-like hydrolase n=1 Tax=Methylomusa anaerophila TaxID=1930071 RepID=A0A348AFL8_9FIRM|nr:HAD family hydrolase [Methylomusa anaerophila]BBB89866.1 haloacid dehalogenase-like hydrolase [Methylomusa anaerophila]HML89087.1 HAD family hydrolase [Methylomusa anaerophila]
MIPVQLPNGRQYEFRHVVFDYNGTLAEDGRMADEVRQLLVELAAKTHVAVITADTFGLARQELAAVPGVELIVLAADQDGTEKARCVQEWGGEHTVVVGNGVNDQPMFFIARLKICVLGPEGASTGVLAAANIVVRSPADAIRLLLQPKRLITTLRT